MPVPLVPLKSLAEAKGRLAPEVGPLQRRLLAIAMFEDVIAAPQAVPALAAPAGGSPARGVWRRADAMGCRVVEEPPGAGDLNAALASAAVAGAGNGEALLVVAADLPLASAAGLERVLAAAEAPVAVVPSADGGGTNVPARGAPAALAPARAPPVWPRPRPPGVGPPRPAPRGAPPPPGRARRRAGRRPRSVAGR